MPHKRTSGSGSAGLDEGQVDLHPDNVALASQHTASVEHATTFVHQTPRSRQNAMAR